MYINKRKSASGYYGIPVNVTSAGTDNEVTYAFYPDTVMAATTQMLAGITISESYIAKKLNTDYNNNYPDNVSFITIEYILGVQFALCSASWEDNGSWTNEFVYVLASRLNLKNIESRLPMMTMNVLNGDGYKNAVSIDDNKPGSAHLGEVWMAIEDTWLMNTSQVMLNSCDQVRDSSNMIADNINMCYEKNIDKGSILSVLYKETDPFGNKIGPDNPETGYPNEYLLVIYNSVYKYVKKSAFVRFTGIKPIQQLLEEYVSTPTNNLRFSEENIKIKTEACMMLPEQVINWKGNHAANVSAGNYLSLKPANSEITVVGHEIIRGTKFVLCRRQSMFNLYMLYDALDGSTGDPSLPPNSWIEKPSKPDESIDFIDPSDNENTIGNMDNNTNSSEYHEEENINSINRENYRKDNPNYKWYDVTLEAGIYPDKDMNDKTGASYLENYQDDRLPVEWDGTSLLSDSLNYELARYPQKYLDFNTEGGHIDKRQITKINRFKFLSDMGGLSTKSFIFMTRPDLNIYALDSNNVVINGTMNPDLKRIPEFKYIGRNKDVGFDILDSLEYWGTNTGTPWLSVITNQALGYNTIDREISYTDVGETQHGHKVLYGKHDFKYNIAGTVSIPFLERRDLSLYYTIKLWTEYIHNLNIGLVSPHPVHIRNKELDYAVSLFYIQTDETMENILYWEKLTGVFPLKCPDSFFSWDRSNPGKTMEYEIEFAYSMRSVLKTPDLLELDRLYMKGAANDAPTEYQAFQDFNRDFRNSSYIANMAAYFGNERLSIMSEDDKNRIKYYDYKYDKERSLQPETQEFNDFVNSLINNNTEIERFYYEPFNDGRGYQPWFLPNYLPTIQSHGIPYVKGPYVVPHPDYNGGKFLLKWV